MTGRNDLLNDAMRQMREMRLNAMADELTAVISNPEDQKISTYELLSRITDAEYEDRCRTRINSLIKHAKFSNEKASLDDIDYSPDRDLNKDIIDQLRSNDYIQNHRNVIVGGPAGAGKSFILQALGINACNARYHVLYYGMFDLMAELSLHNTPDKMRKFLKKLSKPEVLIIDDFMMSYVNDEAQDYLLKLIDERQNRGTIIVGSQLMEVEWKHKISDPAIGEAILDRLVHNAFRVTLKGRSMREKY